MQLQCMGGCHHGGRWCGDTSLRTLGANARDARYDSGVVVVAAVVVVVVVVAVVVVVVVVVGVVVVVDSEGSLCGTGL